MNKYYYWMKLLGYEIMGVDKKKIDRMALLQKAQEEYEDFIKDMDLTPVIDYFKLGLEARVFKDGNGQVLNKNNDLWWKFDHEGYQYSLRRQPLESQGNSVEDILNKIFQDNK